VVGVPADGWVAEHTPSHFRSMWSEVRAILAREHPVFRRTETPFRQALSRSVPEAHEPAVSSSPNVAGRRQASSGLWMRAHLMLSATMRDAELYASALRTFESLVAARAEIEPRLGDPRTVVPKAFDDAQTIADAFKRGEPVVMDLRGVDKDLSRRLIDFASGTCYALGGFMERVDDGVYRLTPSHVEVRSPADVADRFEGVLWSPMPQRGSEGEAWRHAKPPTPR
jgi:FtsZ-interacting cell division protein YlmF